MKTGKQSIRWRIVLIYFLLVFIALTIVSVFLVNRIEAYQTSALKENIDRTVGESNLLVSLGKYTDLNKETPEIQNYLKSNFSGGFSQELSVVSDTLDICASTNKSLEGRNAADVFDVGLIVSSLSSGEDGESEGKTSDGTAVKNYCYAIKGEDSGKTKGVVYVRADLSSLRNFINQSKVLFVQAIGLGLVITVILSFIMARSITVPINDVTENVQKMSQGDFSAEVPVKSQDEIGQLAEMFNLMRKKLDATLSEISSEKNKLETILEYMADGLVAVDLQGNIMHANPAARELLGVLPQDSMEDYTYESLLGHLSPLMNFSQVLENCRDEGYETNFDYGGLTFAVRCGRFKDENAQDVGVIILVQDITERQKLEDMQTDFVANVSHELKTPLTNIKSYTETLIDGAVSDPETADHFLGIIDSEADRMNRLVKDLLQLSRLDHKQERWNIKESNIVALLSMCVEKMLLTAKQKNQQLNALFDTNADLRVMIDKDRMEQVVLNVLSNAIKYTDEGGRIDVDVFKQDGNIKVVVQDNGIGIPAEQLPRIFERFYRVDKARSRAMGGTGLGLAITKQIVEEHNGTIEADSQEGKGTKITITLPPASRRGTPNIE